MAPWLIQPWLHRQVDEIAWLTPARQRKDLKAELSFLGSCDETPYCFIHQLRPGKCIAFASFMICVTPIHRTMLKMSSAASA